MEVLKTIRPFITRLTLTFAVLALYVYAGMAIAQPVSSSGGQLGPQAKFQHACANESAMFEARTAFIQAKLNLTAEQQPAFAAFIAESRAAGQPFRDFCKAGLPPQTGRTVDRLRAMQRFERAMAETHEGIIAAVDRLDAVLSSDQDAAFADAIFPHGAMAGLHGPRPFP